jgi:hypothetical protein
MSDRPADLDSNGHSHSHRDDEEVQRLLQSAGPRESIPTEDRATIEGAARREWMDLLDARRRRRRARDIFWQLAVAASLAMAVAAGWWWMRSDAPTNLPVRLAAATVERLAGVVRRIGAAPGTAHIASAGEELLVGDEIEVAGSPSEPPGRRGFLALRLANGAAVRIDDRARVRIASASTLELRQGALYVDSGDGDGSGRGANAVEVLTRFGVVHEVGTQFEVRVEDAAEGSIRVRVREGSLLLRQAAATHPARAGEEMIVRSSGVIERHALDPYGEAWSWVLDAAPTLDIESISLRTYLEWVARETGWRVDYATSELEETAATILLHGTIAGLRPDESVNVVLPGSGLGHRIESGTLRVLRPGSARKR